MSFNNVLVSCIQNSLDEIDLDKYKNVDIYDTTDTLNDKNLNSSNNDELKV